MVATSPKITVLGDGGWGTTLATLCAYAERPVTLWGVFPEHIQRMRDTRENAPFLPGIPLPKSLGLTSDPDEALKDAELIVLAVPSQYVRQTLEKIKASIPRRALMVSATKGIEQNTLMRMSEVIREVLGPVSVAALSGPTIAREVAQGLPAACVVAAADQEHARLVQRTLSAPHFRLYTHSDMIGVELGGSLKNVIAIAAGIADGLGFGTNSKSALLTRGMLEMSRLGIACGASQETFWGLSGFGDLITTCVSPQSRNRSLGEALGKGQSLQECLGRTPMVVEGVDTAQSAWALAQRHAVDMPITHEVYDVLYHGKPPLDAVEALLERDQRDEFEDDIQRTS